MKTKLSSLAENLLATPGADKVLLTWVDPDMHQLCVQEILTGESCFEESTEAVQREIYLIGKFALPGRAGVGDISDEVNQLRTTAGLPPICVTMQSRLDFGGNGRWEGAIKVSEAPVA